MAVAMFDVGRSKIICRFQPFSIEKIAVRVSPADNVSALFRRNLFATLGQEPGAVSRQTGEAASA